MIARINYTPESDLPEIAIYPENEAEATTIALVLNSDNCQLKLSILPEGMIDETLSDYDENNYEV